MDEWLWRFLSYFLGLATLPIKNYFSRKAHVDASRHNALITAIPAVSALVSTLLDRAHRYQGLSMSKDTKRSDESYTAFLKARDSYDEGWRSLGILFPAKLAKAVESFARKVSLMDHYLEPVRGTGSQAEVWKECRDELRKELQPELERLDGEFRKILGD